MNESVYSGIYFGKCTERNDSYDFAVNNIADFKLVFNLFPRIVLGFFESERDFAFFFVKIKNINFNFITNIYNL